MSTMIIPDEVTINKEAIYKPKSSFAQWPRSLVICPLKLSILRLIGVCK